MGLEKGRSLKSDSAPTIFERPVQSLPADTSIVQLLWMTVMQSSRQKEPEELMKREKDPGKSSLSSVSMYEY